MLRANLTAVCVRKVELLAMEYSSCRDRIGSLSNAVYVAGNCRVDLFCYCDLDLDLMTVVYKLDVHCLEIQKIYKYELSMLNLSKVIV